MEIWIWFAAAGVFLGGVLVYLLFMVFLPEWVGITGKTAIEAEKSHQGGTSAGPELLSRLQREHHRPDTIGEEKNQRVRLMKSDDES